MEDIEYLEEYRDLVLPALNSAAAAAAASSQPNKNSQNQQINDDGDDSSSSLDQDIFNCLFDDNSDDDEDFNNYQNSDSESALNSKTVTSEHYEKLDGNIVEIAEKVEISRQDQTNNFSAIAKTANKITTAEKSIEKSSVTTANQTTFENKAKSVATVRPTIQNQKQQQQQQQNLHKKSNLLQRQTPSTSTSSFIQRRSPSTSTASTSSRSAQLPVLARKPLPSTVTLSASSNNKKSVASYLSTVRSTTDFGKRPATIVKPEKIITKDPANDPLELDNLSEAGSDNYSLSDISGETYNSISDFEDEESNTEYYSGNDDYYEDEYNEGNISSSSQVIELSNDSCGVRSNLEDLRAPTPYPVISDESDTSIDFSGFKISKTKSTKPYSHPDIIESVLRKSEKPKLLDLLHKYNLLEDSVENDEGDNIIIDITTSRENLVESLDPQQVASFKNTLPESTTTATTTRIDSLDLNQKANDKSLTSSSINKNPSKHSKSTNKKKTKKKSVTNMDDSRNLKSPGAVSTDSDLSAIEELLEESYAEAMKRVKDVPYSNQVVGAEMEIGGEEEVTATKENKLKLPKTGVVIDYDDTVIDEQVEVKKVEETKAEIVVKSDTGQKETGDLKTSNIKESEELLESETKVNIEIEDNKINKIDESLECSSEQKVIVKEDLLCKKETAADNSPSASNIECPEKVNLLSGANSSNCDSPNSRKRKRFRNLLTPEPVEKPSETAKSIDDIKDFEGFEDIQIVEKDEKIETKNKTVTPQSIEKTQEKTSEKDRLPTSFKSPSNSHQSLTEKAKGIKDKSSRDNSKESKDKSPKHSKHSKHAKHSKHSKHSKSKSRDSSKDRSSRGNSRDKASRESSKDRSRESSKDRSKHRHHKDHRRSSDYLKDSSKSRESSKSRDSKESKHTKMESHDSHKSTTIKKSQSSSESNKEKYSENKGNVSKEIDKHAKNLPKSSVAESKTSTKDRDNSKDLKEHKNTSEKKDNKSAETISKSKESSSSKYSSSNKSQNSSRDPSKESKNIRKSIESTKSSSSESKKSEQSKNQKTSIDLNKSASNTPSSFTPSSDNLKYSKTSVTPTDDLKCLKDTKKTDKIMQKSSDEPKSTKPIAQNLNDTPVISKDSKTSKPNLSASKSIPKSNESDKKDQQKIIKDSSSDSEKKLVKRADLEKKDTTDLNISVNEKKELNKITNKSDGADKTKKETSKETACAGSSSKRPEESGAKPNNLDVKNTSGTKSISDNIQKIKPIVVPDMKSKDKSFEVKTTTETSKNTNGSPLQRKSVEVKNKAAKQVSMPAKPKEGNMKTTEASDSNTNQATKVNKTEKTKALTPVLEKHETKDYQVTTNLKESSEASQDDSVKETIAKGKNDDKEPDKKETLQPKAKETNLNENQVNADKQQIKKAENANNKVTEEKDASNNVPIQTNTAKREVLSSEEQKEKEQEKNESKKIGNLNDVIKAKEKVEITANKDKIKSEKPTVSTTKPAPSPKAVKKAQKQIATKSVKNTDPIDSDKPIKTKIKEHKTKEANIEEGGAASVQENKIDTKKTSDTAKLQETSVESSINCETNQENQSDPEPSLATTKLQDTKMKDAAVTDNKMETKKSKRNLDEEIKQNEKIAQQPSDTKPIPMGTKQSGDKLLKSTTKSVSQKNVERDSSSESRKTKSNIMEQVLQKSVVILIEPLKLIPPIIINAEDNIEIEPRRTRSRISNPKLNASVTKEESKEKTCEGTETRKPKKYSEPSASGKIDKIKNDQNDKHNVESTRTRKRSDLKTELVKTEINADKETAALRKETTSSEDKDPRAGDRKKEIEEEYSEPMQKRRRLDVKNETENEKSEISLNGMSKDASSTPKENEEHIESKKFSISSAEGKALAEKVVKEDNSRPRKTRRRGGLEEKESESEKDTTSHDSSIKKDKEEHNESIKTKRRGDIKGEKGKEAPEIINVETIDRKNLSKIETEKMNIESIITIRRGDYKEEEEEKEKKETSQIELSDEKTSTQREVKEHFEPTKTRRRRCDIKEQTGKEKCETSQIESAEEKILIEKEAAEKLEPTNSKKQNDLKEVGKEKTENSINESSDKKSSIEKESEEHFDSIKTRKDLETEAEKEENLNFESVKNNREVVKGEKGESPTESSLERKSIQSKAEELDSESIKPEIREDPKQSQTEPVFERNSKQKQTKELFEPMKTRRRADHKEDIEKEKNQISNEKKSEQKEVEEHFEPIKSRSHGEPKEEEAKEKSETLQMKSSDEKSAEQKEVEAHFEPIETRRHGESKEEVTKEKNESLLIESSDEKSAEEKEVKEHMEPIKTSKRGEIKEDIGKEQNETSNEKNYQQREVEEYFAPIETRRHGEPKEEIEQKESETLQMESSDKRTAEQKDVKQHLESIKTERYVELKKDAKKEKCKTSNEKSLEQNEVEEHIEPIKTRSHGEPKEEVAKEKKENLTIESLGEKSTEEKELKEHLEPMKTRKRGELRADKEKSEASDEASSEQKEVEKHLEPIKTRRHGELKEEAEKEKSEASHDKLFDEKPETEELEPIKTKSRGDSKVESEREKSGARQGKSSDEKTSAQREKIDHKEKKEVPQIEISDETRSDLNKSKELNFAQIKTRTRRDLKGETKKETTETPLKELICEKSVEQAESIPGIVTDETEKDKSELSINVVSSKERTSVGKKLDTPTEEQHFKPRKTRSRGDVGKEKDEISQGNHSQSSEKKNLTGESILKNKVGENVELKKINHGENEKEKDLQRPPVHSARKDESNTSHIEEVISTADEKHSEEIISKALSDDVDPNENSKIVFKQVDLPKTNSQIEKKSQEVLNLEIESSGSEYSITSSNSENILRRTLRKRGAETPFPENDTNKKAFKEPPLKPTTQFTPKGTKVEKAATNVLVSSSKRTIRSPIADAENPSSTKKPKLETSLKSTRSRGLYEDCLEEEELPIVTAEFGAASKERLCFETQSAVLDKQKLNEPATITLKSTKNKNTKEVKEISTDKKAEEKKKEAKTPQASVNVPQKVLSINEVPKQRANKEGLNTETTLNVIAKKKVPETAIQSKTNKAKVNVSPNKSPGCTTVMSFSDWLKTKNQDEKTENKDKLTSAPTNESTPDSLVRQSRINARLTPKISDKKPIEDKEKTAEVAKEPNKVKIFICQSKEKGSKDEQATLENIDISEQPDNSSPQPTEDLSQNALKEQKTSNKKPNLKRLQKKPSSIKSSPTNSNTTTLTTSPRMKKTEIDLLIQSMSKEMKDGGINDLLKSDTHVKRQRLANKRNRAEHFESYKIPAAPTRARVKETNLAAAVVALPNEDSSDLMTNTQIPKVFDFAENQATPTTNIPSSKEVSRSPTRRKVLQNSVESKRSSLKPIISDVQENTKALSPKSQKSLNIKELSRTTSTSLIKSRKSLPLMLKESLAKDTNVSSRKSLTIPKQQQPREQVQSSDKYVFRTPKQVNYSAILNLIPRAESIKKLYADDKKRTDSRIKINRTECLFKAFKCRKLRVQLDRSVVEKYLKSINNGEKERSKRKQTVLKDVSGLSKKSTDNQQIIQNSSQSSLRIQSVVDASTIHGTVSSSTIMTNAQDSLAGSGITSNAPILQGSNGTSVPIPVTQQQAYVLSSRGEASASLNTSIINVADVNENIELKNEFMDENPIELINDAILPDTPTLLARAQCITEAAQHALSNSVTPTDIRLIAADNLENNFVPSFGVMPTALDNKGTCMYTFLHPAKYNRNHSNVLLDYCCPNLDGPMPAIDPTRIHAQVQVPIIELPASIVLTTKVVTRADLESDSSPVPAIIRKKAEKIRKNMATHHKMAVATSTTSTPAPQIVSIMTHPNLASAPRHALPATINALTKQLPSTTTITPKIHPPLLVQKSRMQSPSPNLAPPVASAISKNTTVSVVPKGNLPLLSSSQHLDLRSNLRRFDVLLKQLIQPYESLSFADRHHVIDAIITSGKFLPNDLEQTLLLMEEYITQTLLLKNSSFNQPPSTSAILSTNNYITSQVPVASPLPATQMPQLQPSPKILASTAPHATPNPYSRQLEQVHNKAVTKIQSRSKNTSLTSNTIGEGGVVIKQKQVPIYDTDRNIIGYQMRMMTPMTTMPAFTKSTMSTRTGAIMSTSLETGNNKITEYSLSKRPVKRPAQGSPRVFYTTPPLKTSTPKAITNPQIYLTQSKNANTIAQKTQQKGSIVTTIRSASGNSSSASSETITTTTTATVKRITRSTATGSKLIIVSKSNQSSEETILPDANSSQQTEQTEIKDEKDID